MQTLIVILIVSATVFFLGRRLWHTAQGKGGSGCGCGCSECPHHRNCDKNK